MSARERQGPVCVGDVVGIVGDGHRVSSRQRRHEDVRPNARSTWPSWRPNWRRSVCCRRGRAGGWGAAASRVTVCGRLARGGPPSRAMAKSSRAGKPRRRWRIDTGMSPCFCTSGADCSHRVAMFSDPAHRSFLAPRDRGATFAASRPRKLRGGELRAGEIRRARPPRATGSMMRKSPPPTPPPSSLDCGPMRARGWPALLVVALLGVLLGSALVAAVALDRSWFVGAGAAGVLAVVLDRSWFRA